MVKEQYSISDSLSGWFIGRERNGWSAIPDDDGQEIIYATTHAELLEKIKEIS